MAEAFFKLQKRKNTGETDTGIFFVKVKFEKGSDASTPRFVKEKIRETDKLVSIFIAVRS